MTTLTFCTASTFFGWSIPLKYAFVCIVGVASTLLVWLVQRALKAKVIFEFERGFTLNYASIRIDLNEDAEVLSFPYRHLCFGQVKPYSSEGCRSSEPLSWNSQALDMLMQGDFQFGGQHGDLFIAGAGEQAIA